MRSLIRYARSALLAAVPFMLVAFAAPASAQERSYEEGTVWDVTFVRTTPGHYEDYLADLSRVWRTFNEEAVKKSYVKSFKVLSAPRGSENDWDLILMVEYPNMAMLDNAAEKFDPIARSVIGDLQEVSEATVERSQFRVIMGSKLARELTFTNP